MLILIFNEGDCLLQKYLNNRRRKALNAQKQKENGQ